MISTVHNQWFLFRGIFNPVFRRYHGPFPGTGIGPPVKVKRIEMAHVGRLLNPYPENIPFFKQVARRAEITHRYAMVAPRFIHQRHAEGQVYTIRAVGFRQLNIYPALRTASNL